MQTIEINATKIAKEMGRKTLTDYMAQVIEHGDQPGVLSGSNLQGKASKYGASYAKTRAKVAKAVETVTSQKVRDGYAKIGNRECRVWVDSTTGEPVELTLTDD